MSCMIEWFGCGKPVKPVALFRERISGFGTNRTVCDDTDWGLSEKSHEMSYAFPNFTTVLLVFENHLAIHNR